MIKEKIEICYTVRQHLNCLRCDCNGYDREGIPCRHEYAVAKKFGLKNKLRKIASFNISEVIRNALGNEYECPNIHTHTVCVPYYKAAPYNISHT